MRFIDKNKYNLFRSIICTITFPALLLAFGNSLASIEWIHTQSYADGSYQSEQGIATDYQATSEVLRTFKALNASTSNLDTTIYNFIHANHDLTTEHLARKIILQQLLSINADTDLTTLVTTQNIDGGFGFEAAYDSTIEDTAYALEALGTYNLRTDLVARALSFILNKQNANGGWSDGNNTSDVFLTALTMQSLLPYKDVFTGVTASLNAAEGYLLAQRGANQLWKQTFESALSIIAILEHNDAADLTNSIDALVAAKLANDSWDNDVYQTALALRAIKTADNLLFNTNLSEVKGRVLDAATGLPLSGVAVSLQGGASANQQSANDGTFSFKDLEPGAYTLNLTLTGYNSVSTSVTTSAGQRIDVGNISLTTEATVSTGSISGAITSAETGLPLAGVAITVTGVANPAITDANGRYQITNVSTGPVTITATKSGYSSAVGNSTVTAGGLLIFSTALSQVTTQTTAIKGTIVDANDGQPLSGVTVSVTGATTSSTTTDASGNYQIADLNSGAHTLAVSLSGYDTVNASADINENVVLIFSPKLYPENTSPTDANTTGVTGVVMDAGTNQPIANAQVSATFGSQTKNTTTGSDGRFTISGLAEPNGTLQFVMAGYKGVTSTVSLSPLKLNDIGQIRLQNEQTTILLPDLTIESVDVSTINSDQQTAYTQGNLTTIINNSGTSSSPANVDVVAYYDQNKDGRFDNSDLKLGEARITPAMDPNTTESIQITIDGSLPFRDAPITVSVDTAQAVVELNEVNNSSITTRSCKAGPAIGSFNPVVKYQAVRGTPVIATPMVINLTDDNGDSRIDENDIPDMVFATMPGNQFSGGPLKAISGDDGRELFTTSSNVLLATLSEVATGDIDGDGFPEIIAAHADGQHLVAFEHNGVLKWVSDTDTLPGRKDSGGSISIANLDGQGAPEIIIGASVYSAEGKLLGDGRDLSGKVGFNYYTAISSVADIDRDGIPEIIAGSSAYNFQNNVLSLKWVRAEISDGFVGIANFDDDPEAEVIIVGNGRLYMLNHDGSSAELWGASDVGISLPGGGYGGAPTVSDFDGDGKPEIGIAGATAYSVFDTDGSVLWSSTTRDNSSSTTGSTSFDFEGDGTTEIIYRDELKLRIYSGIDGSILFERSMHSGTATEMPVVADVDNDGQAEVIVVSDPSFGGSIEDTGVYVFEGGNNDWRTSRRIWNQHSYHITNINEDGTVPVIEKNSWEVHNTYRLNTQPGVSVTSDLDLTTSWLQIINQGASGFSLSVRVGNAGGQASQAGADVSFFEGDPSLGGILLGTKQLSSIAGGDFVDIQLDGVVTLNGNQNIYAVIDYEVTVLECNKNNNQTFIPGPQLIADLTVDSVSIQGVSTNLDTLEITGSVETKISNIGTLGVSAPFGITAYHDANSNDAYDVDVDAVLGTINHTTGLFVGPGITVNIPVNGQLPFRNASISIWIDSSENVVEVSESNNEGDSSLSCRIEPNPSGVFDPVLKWTWNGSSVSSSGNVYGPAVVGQFNDDNNDGEINKNDVPDLVFNSNTSTGGILNIVSGIDGTEIFSNSLYKVTRYGSPSIGDIDNDGLFEIVVVNNDRTRLLAIEHDGALKWSVPTGPRHSDSPRDSVTIADLDGDGNIELINGNRVYDANGQLLWIGGGDGGGERNYGYIPIAADIDLDSKQEVIAGRTAYKADGSILWHRNDLPSDGFNAVGNFDEDDFAEIVLVASSRVFLLDQDGSTIWGPINIPGGGVGGAPTIADMDGDGEPEIGVAGASYYVVFETDGTVKWQSPTQDYSSSRTGSSVFDFEADGRVEVLYADETRFRIYDGSTGNILLSINNTSGTTLEYPVVVDIDNDNQAEIIFGSNDSGTRGVHVYESASGSWAPTRKIWNQHAYSINNINDDGSIPAHPQPSWLTHNTYRLNTFADRDPLASSDLTVSKLNIIDNGQNQTVSIRARIGNAGVAVTPDSVLVAVYEDDPATVGIKRGEVNISPIAINSFTDIQIDNLSFTENNADIYVVADSVNKVDECNENNNIAIKQVGKSQSGGITVQTDKLFYEAESDVSILGAITNTGGREGNFTAELSVTDLNGVLVANFAPHTVNTLSSGSSVSISDGWNTANTIAGPYLLQGVLRDSAGKVISQASSDFSIGNSVTGEPAVISSIVSDKPTYKGWDTVNLTARIQNISSNVILPSSLIEVTVKDPSAAVIYYHTLSEAEMLAGALKDLSFTLNLADAPSGLYTVDLSVKDKLDQTYMTSASTSFTVGRLITDNLVGTVAATPRRLERGEAAICTDSVVNRANSDLTGVTIRHQVLQQSTGNILADGTSIIDLVSNVPQETINSHSTNSYESGVYYCILSAELDGNVKQLAASAFEVLVPPIDISSTFELGPTGRLLVLLDVFSENSECHAGNELSLSHSFTKQLAADATVHIELQDASGSVLDAEDVILDTVDYPVNTLASTASAELRITDFNANGLTATVYSPTGAALNGSYQLKVTVTDSVSSLPLISGLIELACNQPMELGAVLGDFTVTTLILPPVTNATSDPHGPQVAPTLGNQRHYLEQLLTANGWSYTIVTDADDFARELRTGGYTSYALFSEQIKLAETVQKELREAVYRGDGLLVSGSHDNRNHTVFDALGIKVNGKHADADGVQGITDVIPNTLLAYPDKVLNVELEGATAASGYLSVVEGALSPHTDGNTSMATHDYGLGRSAFAGVDLLAHATRLGGENHFSELILHWLSHIQPDEVTALPGGVVPIKLTLTNLGVATPGEVILSFSDGVTVIDSGIAVQLDDGDWHWFYDLAEEGAETLTLWVQLPNSLHDALVTATINTGTAPDLIVYDEVTLTIVPQPLPELSAIQSELSILANDKSADKAYGRANNNVEKAQTWLSSNNIDKALDELLRATDELASIDEERASIIRLNIDWVIVTISNLLNQ